MIDLGLIGDLYVFVLAGFLGYQVISRVSPLLHTPLMSATNAISGISLVGSLVVAGAGYNEVSTLLGFVAVTASTINVVGGFLITDRILKMFRAGKSMQRNLLQLFYLLSAILFVMGLRALTLPSPA